MINPYDSEQEQLEALQKWWKENGTAIIVGILLGATAVIGWSSWRAYVTQQTEMASSYYEQLLALANKHSHKETIKKGELLVEQFPNSGYSALASLIMARVAFQQNDIERTKTNLRQAITQEEHKAAQKVARLRLARLLIDEGEHTEAMTLLDGNTKEGFSGLYKETRGDIFFAQNDPIHAYSAYAESLVQSTPKESRSQTRVRMKLDDLGTQHDNK